MLAAPAGSWPGVSPLRGDAVNSRGGTRTAYRDLPITKSIWPCCLAAVCRVGASAGCGRHRQLSRLMDPTINGPLSAMRSHSRPPADVAPVLRRRPRTCSLVNACRQQPRCADLLVTVRPAVPDVRSRVLLGRHRAHVPRLGDHPSRGAALSHLLIGFMSIADRDTGVAN